MPERDSKPEELTLASPCGMPPDEAAASQYYSELRTRLSAQVEADQSVTVWIDDENEYSSVHAMSKGILWYSEASPQSAVPKLLLKVWLWDYLAIRTGSMPGDPTPTLVEYRNLDTETVKTAMALHLETNPRYADWSATDRLAALTRFLTGKQPFLVDAGTLIGRGATETAGANAGRRRVAFSFSAGNDSTASPRQCLELWAALRGPILRAHPLFESLAPPIVPPGLPVEGGIRLQVRGDGFNDAAVVTIADSLATDIAASDDGTFLYATAPAAPTGMSDVRIELSDGAVVEYSNAVTYVEELLLSVRYCILSYIIALTEIRNKATSAVLDVDDRARLRREVEVVGGIVDNAIAARADATNASLYDPAITSAWEAAQNYLFRLKTEIRDALE